MSPAQLDGAEHAASLRKVAMAQKNWLLTLFCQDKPRIVATTSRAIADIGGNIQESGQFWDRATNRFFMRIAFETPTETDRKTVETVLDPVVKRFEMSIVLTDADALQRIIIMVRSRTTVWNSCCTRSEWGGSGPRSLRSCPIIQTPRQEPTRSRSPFTICR